MAAVHSLAAGGEIASAQALSSAATTALHLPHIDDTADTSQCTAFSRSTGLPTALGKATEDCKTKLPFDTKADVLRVCHSLGMSESEWVRLQVMKGLYGAEVVESMHLHRIRAAVGMGPIGAPDEAASK